MLIFIQWYSIVIITGENVFCVHMFVTVANILFNETIMPYTGSKFRELCNYNYIDMIVSLM